MRETNGALFNTEGFLPVDNRVVADLRLRAERSPTRRYRLCLHHSPEDLIQEMLVVHCRDNYSRPHAHSSPLTYLVLDGELRVLLFDNAGAVTQTIDLAPVNSGQPFALRIDAGRWYMPVCLSPQVVFYETKMGPFRRDDTNLWAPWSPADDDARGIAAYRRSLGIDEDT